MASPKFQDWNVSTILLLARGRDRLETTNESSVSSVMTYSLLLARGRDRLETNQDALFDFEAKNLLLARGRDRLETITKKSSPSSIISSPTR